VNALHEVFVNIAGTNPVLQGLAGGVVIAFLNVIGALVILVWRNPSERSLDGALGFAAGAMLYVISDEIIPETHIKGHERIATLGTILGVMVMLYLDVSLA
jgi:ZIP family zinc transporter